MYSRFFPALQQLAEIVIYFLECDGKMKNKYFCLKLISVIVTWRKLYSEVAKGVGNGSKIGVRTVVI